MYKTIERAPSRQSYTVIANLAIRDTRLSFKARGLHHLLLSYADGWIINVNHLVTQSPDLRGEGRTGINTALKELEACGYLTRKQERNSNGTFGQYHYMIHELPVETDTNEPHSSTPVNDSPDHGLPDSGSPNTYINNNSKNQQKEERRGTLSLVETYVPQQKSSVEKCEKSFEGRLVPHSEELTKGEKQWLATSAGQWLLRELKDRGIALENWKAFLEFYFNRYLVDYLPEEVKRGTLEFFTRLRNAITNKLRDENGESFLNDYLDIFSSEKPQNPVINREMVPITVSVGVTNLVTDANLAPVPESFKEKTKNFFANNRHLFGG